MHARTRHFIGAALALVLAIGGASAASAASSASLTATPDSIAVGDSATVDATDLGGLETATFGLDATPGGSLKVMGASGSGTTAEAPVTDGKAAVEFSSTEAGTFTVTVGDGETVLATTTIVVTAAGGGGGSVATVAASPASVAVGAASTITATGLGGLESVSFGLDGTPGGSLSAEEARVAGGSASVEFTATESGTFTVAVSDGETVLGTTTVTVTAAEPTPTPTPTPDAPSSGLATELIWIIVILGVLVIGAVVAIIVVARRRRSGQA